MSYWKGVWQMPKFRRVFEDPNEPDIWITDENPEPEKYVLVTVSGEKGEQTVLVTSDKTFESKARHFVQAPKERVVQGSDKFKNQIARSIKLVGYVFITVMLTFSVLSFAGITKARIVLTESMQPTINPGDIVLSLNPERLPPKVGDIVTYTGRRYDGTAVASFTHRVMSGDAQNGFVMKGDNNPAPDTQQPTLADISGVVFYTIPIIGKLLTPRGLLVLVPSIFGLWLVIDALRNEK
jgi:signal peptidase I